MSFKMNCDRCDKFIKNVSADEMRETLQGKKEVLCKECMKTEETLLRFVELKQNAALQQLKEFVTNFKDEIRVEIRKVVGDQVE